MRGFQDLFKTVGQAMTSREHDLQDDAARYVGDALKVTGHQW